MQIEMKILNKEFYKGVYPGDTASCKRSLESIQDNVKIPSYATHGSAAIDLVATKDYVIYPGEVVPIHTGLAIWIGSQNHNGEYISNDKGTFYINQTQSVAAHIIPRSGRGAKEGLVIANTVGLIDEDYQGELIVYAFNRNKDIKYTNSGFVYDEEIEKRYNDRHDKLFKVIEIKAGERFAQMYFLPVIKPTFKIVEEFSSSTERGEGGFGSTNK